MPPAPNWITISTVSALGLSILATGAVGVANAMPLVDSTTSVEVPPISTVPENEAGDVAGSGDVTFPLPASSPDVSTSAVPLPPNQQAPASRDAPDSVSPASPASVDSDD